MKEYAPSVSDFFSLKSRLALFCSFKLMKGRNPVPPPPVKEWLETISRWSLTSV